MKRYSEYKDSGVKWIGEIPKHWKRIKLKFLTDSMQSGTNLTSFQIQETGRYPVLGGNGIRGYYDKFNCDKECIVIGRQGALCGNVHIIKEKFWATDHAVVTFSNDLTDINFLYYLCNAMNLNQYASQTAAQPGLAVSTIKNIYTSLPPLFEQQEIASYLDNKVSKIDTYISTAEKKIVALDELKQVTIADAVTHGINPNVPMKDSGIPWIGMVPEHWKLTRIKFLFNEISEKEHPEEPCLCSTQKYGVIPQSMYENRVVVVNKGLENLKFVRKGNFVISLRSFQGGIEIAYYQGIISAAYTILSLGNKNISSNYIKYLFKSSPFIQLLQTCVTGIREGQNINYELLRRQFIPIPTLSQQNEIVAYIDRKVAQIDKMKAAELAQIEKLKEYKQRLISDVVTGKVKVTND